MMATDIHGETYVEHLKRNLDRVCGEARMLRAILETERAEKERLQVEITQLKRMLANLTPMGSEFADNPANCVSWIASELSKRLSQTIEAVKAKREYRDALAAKIGECDQLEAENERLSLAIIGICKDRDLPLPSCVASGSTEEF